MDFFHSFPYWHGAFGAFVKEELFICPPLHIFWYMLSMQAGAEGPGFRLGIWFPCFPCLSQESLFRARFDQVSFAWQLPTVFSGESLEVFFRRSCLTAHPGKSSTISMLPWVCFNDRVECSCADAGARVSSAPPDWLPDRCSALPWPRRFWEVLFH